VGRTGSRAIVLIPREIVVGN